MQIPVVMATAELTRSFIPLISSVMALDLVSAEADLNDQDDCVLTLMRLGHSARSVAQCFIPAISKAKEATHAAQHQP